jgi:hypothetical protein
VRRQRARRHTAIGGNPTALAGDLSLGLGGGGGGYGGGAGGSGGCGNHGSNAGGGSGGGGSSFALATGLITNVVVATDTTGVPEVTIGPMTGVDHHHRHHHKTKHHKRKRRHHRRKHH